MSDLDTILQVLFRQLETHDHALRELAKGTPYSRSVEKQLDEGLAARKALVETLTQDYPALGVEP